MRSGRSPAFHSVILVLSLGCHFCYVGFHAEITMFFPRARNACQLLVFPQWQGTISRTICSPHLSNAKTGKPFHCPHRAPKRKYLFCGSYIQVATLCTSDKKRVVFDKSMENHLRNMKRCVAFN